MTASELMEECDIPKSTLYRKLDLLSTASLVREQETINPNGGRITQYRRDFDNVSISMNEDQFSVDIDRPGRKPDERLADIWSKMGDEL
jgi:predicted transcriptional regulator